MITRPTVLVLGAGASMDYNFPSGEQLLISILSNLKGDGWKEHFNYFGITSNLLNQFHDELFYSGRGSIDAFLEHRPEFVEAGKIAIALSLWDSEQDRYLFEKERKIPSWYRYLFGKLADSFESFSQNKLSIITFNYDRSIEHFLMTAIKNSFGKSEEECAEKLKAIPIIHVHGRLGTLPWQGGDSKPYSTNFTYEMLDSVRKQIIIVSEAQPSSIEFQKAFELISSSERTYFLGFGYHPANLEKLRVREIKRYFSGTSLGFGRTEIESLSRWNIKCPDPAMDVYTFLRNHVDLF